MKSFYVMRKMVIIVLCLSGFILGCETPSNGPTDSPIVLIGDSIFALSGEIKNELERLSNESYRSYCVSGSELDGGMMGGNIPGQYSSAVNDNPNIKTIIMDGGCNDVQIGGASVCSGSIVSNACKQELQKALDAADRLFTDMRSDGVENIIYLNYFYFQNDNLQAAFYWMHDQMELLVQKHDGIVVDPMPYMNPSLITSDKIHPNDEGSRLLAGLIWDAMLENDVDPTGGTK
ncbi:MAG: SGNH/GDSL hydrolase family protein [Desulfobacteraceae bacterium]|jgi:hypothetical protein